MRIPKSYGQSKDTDCPFCGQQCTAQNAQGIAVCKDHKDKALDEIKCLCGSWLEPKAGKFGRYYNCINCGNMNYNKVMQIKEMTTPITDSKPVVVKAESTYVKEEPKEVTISSRDVDYFD